MKNIKVDYIGRAVDLVSGLISDKELPYYNMVQGGDWGLEAITFNNGYTVSIGEQNTVKLDFSDLDNELQTTLNIADAIEKQYIIMKDLNKKLNTRAVNFSMGFWVNEGLLYIDINLVIENKNLAIALGLSNKQIAIFDNKNKKEIIL